MYLRSGLHVFSFNPEEIDEVPCVKYPFWYFNSKHLYDEEEREIIYEHCVKRRLSCTCFESRLEDCVNGGWCRKCMCDLCYWIIDPCYPRAGDEFNRRDIVNVKISDILLLHQDGAGL